MTPRYEPHPRDQSHVASNRIAKRLAELLARPDLSELSADRQRVDGFVGRRPRLKDAREDAIVSRLHEMAAIYEDIGRSHLLATTLGMIQVGIVTRLCHDLLRDPSLSVRLLTGIGGVESADFTLSMWKLSRRIRADGELTAAFDAGTAGIEERLKRSSAGIGLLSRIDHFLREHGSRGHNEWELLSATFDTAPSMLYGSLDRMRLVPDDQRPVESSSESTVARRKLVVETLGAIRSIDIQSARDFEFALRSAESLVRAREQAKTTLVRLLHEGRLACLELGRRMVERGVLARVEETAMLHLDELDDFIKCPGAWRSTIGERQLRYDALSELEPPPIIYREIPPGTTWAGKRPSTGHLLRPGESVEGVVGSPGRVVGRARVVHDPLDPAGLEPGDVLVAPETDPGWLPLLVVAGAVVVDTGSETGHATVVCRELGIPCVVRATGATCSFDDGALVEVDGNAGRVILLEAAPPASQKDSVGRSIPTPTGGRGEDCNDCRLQHV